MEVIVYLLTSNADSPRTHHVKSLFDHSLFVVDVVTVDEPHDLVIPPGMNREQSLEHRRMDWCFQDARSRYSDNPIIIVKDTTVSNSSPETIAEIITTALGSSGWDVCYLCKWLDRCDLYTEKMTIPGKTTIIAKTQAPQGTQAILLTPRGRDLLIGAMAGSNKSLSLTLQEQILAGKIQATCVVPNLLEYDVTAATSNFDYLKTHECQDLIGGGGSINSGTTKENSSSWGWLWIIILVILILLLGYWYYSRRSAY